MLINNQRRIPGKNDLNKYAVNLGQTAAEVKEYFDVSAYRNVLDMLNTFEGVLNRWRDDLYNNAITLVYTRRLNFGSGVEISGQTITGKAEGITYPPAAMGYAASQIGRLPNQVYLIPTHIDKVLKANGMKGIPTQTIGTGWLAYMDITAIAIKAGYFAVPDLLNLARQINWELNRLRLPVPHNFRQINDKIQGRNYGVAIFGKKTDPFCEGSWSGCKATSFRNFPAGNYTNLVELIKTSQQLKQAIAALRVSTRKEIDAANVAKKVQEETIRKEQEELITRQQAAEQTQQREIEILAEKKASYEQELAQAEAIKKELADTREQLAAELEQLQAAKQTAQAPEEIAVIEEKETEVIQAAVQADVVEQDINRNIQTSVRAATNLNDEIITVQKDLQEQGIMPSKKPNLTPIILTIAAGLLLS